MEIQSANDLIEHIEEHGADATLKANRKKPLPSRALRDLYSYCGDEHEKVLFLATYPLIPSDLAEDISAEKSQLWEDVAIALASNPRSPQQSLNRLCSHASTAVRLTLAANPNLSPKEFQILADDADPFVRATAAENPSLPNFLQFVLAADPEVSVKAALAARPNLDPDVAHHLSRDPSILVKTAVICHAAVEDEQGQLWADLDDLPTQLLLLKTKHADTRSILQSLRFSPHHAARVEALKKQPLKPYEMLWLAESDYVEDRLFLATQDQLPTAIQRILAQDSSDKVRRHLAANPSLDPAIALHIAASVDTQACSALAKNPSVSAALVAELCLHPNPDVATLVAYREDLEERHWDLLINHRTDTRVAQHIAFQGIEYSEINERNAARFAQSKNPSLRAFAALSIHLSPESLATLSMDPCDKVREAAASNPRIPEGPLRELCYDLKRDIAEIAEKTLGRRLRSNEAPMTAAPDYTRAASESRAKILDKIITFFKD